MKYKITQKDNLYYVYKRLFIFFWIYQETFSNLENAKRYIDFELTHEIKIFEK